MKIYYSDIRGIDSSQALCPPMSPSPGSALGMSLLAVAYEDYAKSALPPIKRLLSGKPVFSDSLSNLLTPQIPLLSIFANNPKLHFSISHSRTHVLCALSETPVGADTLDHRKVRESTINALATREELEHFTFHELWALRESFFKLTGEGDLRTLRFHRENDAIKAPRTDVYSRLYDDIENSSTAVATFENSFPDKLIKIPIEKLLKKPSKLS